jgi:polysaccharide biosynthesis protein PslG
MTRRTSRLIAGLIIVAIALVIGLAADLYFRGLAWRMFYALTGEEGIAGQLNGMLQVAGNLTRPLPAVSAAPAGEVSPNMDGVNTFLEDEVEPAKRERQLQMIKEAGFGWIRQQFRWDDLEISARGDFTDRRNSPEISAWDKYDNIVALSERYGVRIMARLGSPPRWSQAEGALPGYEPPTNYDDFANYARTLATRYKGKITHWQVWNEPNLTPEWGNLSPDPEAYTDLLCRTFKVLKEVDPANVVIMGALGPTFEISERNLTDYLYLQRMYDAGAGKCFDILSVQGYGLRSSPADQRMRATFINFNHPLYLREIMVNNGDAAKPIWISEMAWNPVPDDPTIKDKERFGQVTDEQAARYGVEAWERIRREWKWVGVVNYWFFKRAGDSERDQSWYYFRMVDPDFTPRPVYGAFKDYLQSKWGSP